MKPSLRPQRISRCIPGFDQRLTAYALAASAAGVGVLALVQPAESEIIYTKTHKRITPNTTLHLDLNHDGVVDFDLSDKVSYRSIFYAAAKLADVPAARSNRIVGHIGLLGKPYASALFAGLRVGPKGQFLPSQAAMAESIFSTTGARPRPATQGFCTGPWGNVTSRYLGLKFLILGEVHFGWARLNVTCKRQFDISAVLTGYAYETVPNRPIVTGKEKGTEENGVNEQGATSEKMNSLQPASLGQLALGASGRRR
jgi:hypothetical protein